MEAGLPSTHGQRAGAAAGAERAGERVLAAVLRRRPVLERLLLRAGHLPLLAHAADLVAPAPGAVSERGLAAVAHWTERLFGAEARSGISAQLRECPAVNTAEHLAPMFQPRRFQGNLLAARGAAERGQRYLLVLACSRVSMANSSYPGGIIWNGCRLPLITGDVNSRSVLSLPAVDRARFRALLVSARLRAAVSWLLARTPELRRVAPEPARVELPRGVRAAVLAGQTHHLLAAMRTAGLSAALERQVLASLPGAVAAGNAAAVEIEEHLLHALPASLFAETNYGFQVCRLNAVLWERAMPLHAGMPRLIYLPLEAVTVKLLQESLRNAGDPLAAMLFEPAARELALELFAGVPGAWSAEGGSHFLWGRVRKGRLVPLRLSGAELRGHGARLELRAEIVAAQLAAGTLVPGTLLQLLALLQHGFRCLGGANQVDYLPLMIERMEIWCRLLGFAAPPVQRAPAAVAGDDFTCGPLYWLRREATTGRPTFGSLDAFLRAPERSFVETDAAVRSVNLRAATLLGMLELYRDIVPKAEREPELEALEPATVAKEAGVPVNCTCVQS
jgi:hypothetical protein